MKIAGTYEFGAPQELVWQALLDPDVLAQIMSGCQALEMTGEDEYKGQLNIRVGPVQGTFKGTVKLSNLDAPNSYDMRVNAQGAAGMVDGNGSVWLEEEDDKTLMHYSGDAHVSGRIASVGQRVMETSARVITTQSLENLEQQIQSRIHPNQNDAPSANEQQASTQASGPAASSDANTNDVAAAPDRETSTDSQSELAGRIARDLFDEFVPKDKQPWILAGLGVLACYLVFNWWTNAIARRVARHLADEGESHMIS